MKTTIVWNDAMKFQGTVGPHAVQMDAKTPIGNDTAATPKELVAMGLGGCTAMDVIALLKKSKQSPQSFVVDVEIQSSTKGYPAVFQSALLTYKVDGDVNADTLIQAVTLSQTKYCGVSAMLAKAFSIQYQIVLNGKQIGTGFANFDNGERHI